MIGVLVMAHGTPATTADIEPFYTRIRRGRPPTDEQLAELTARYDAIGGTSPLAARTAAQVEAIAAALEREHPGAYTVAFGAKHTDPAIEAAAAALAASEVERVVGLVLTPHRSGAGSDQYHERARAALATLPYTPIEAWYDAPGFVAALADRVSAAYRAMYDVDRARELENEFDVSRVVVVFTAHSVPLRGSDDEEVYASQVDESAELVAERAGIDDFMVAWQSAGRTPEPWLGPSLRQVIDELAEFGVACGGATGVVVCPIGFVADHLEVLYDLDVEARGWAEAGGLRFARTPSLNDDPVFIEALAHVIASAP